MEFGPRLSGGIVNLTSESLHGLCWLRRFARCFNTLFFHVVWQLVVPTRQHARQANHDSLGHRNINKNRRSAHAGLGEIGQAAPAHMSPERKSLVAQGARGDRARGPRAHEPIIRRRRKTAVVYLPLLTIRPFREIITSEFSAHVGLAFLHSQHPTLTQDTCAMI